MKITVINNDAIYRNGAFLHIDKTTAGFISELKSLSNDLELPQFIIDSPTVGIGGEDIAESGIHITGFKRYKNRILGYIIAYRRMIGIIRKTDFLYIFYPCRFAYVGLAAVFFKKPFGLYIRGERGIHSRILRFLVSKAYVVLTVSDMYTETARRYGGTNVDTVRPMIGYASGDIVKTREYFSKDVYDLLYVGRLERDKGTYELIKAVWKLRQVHDKCVRLILVGGGEAEGDVRRFVDIHSLHDVILLKGVITDKEVLRNLYVDSDLFVFPSHHEGFPRVLYEAMIFGTPIVTTFVGAIPHLMKANVNCTEIAPKNTDSIVSAIDNILRDYTQIKPLAENATRLIGNYLDKKQDSHARQLYKLIRTIGCIS